MNAQRELRNFYEHYGERVTLEVIGELLESMAIWKGDAGEDREALDNAAEAVRECLS